jgi:neutral trehalase
MTRAIKTTVDKQRLKKFFDESDISELIQHEVCINIFQNPYDSRSEYLLKSELKSLEKFREHISNEVNKLAFNRNFGDFEKLFSPDYAVFAGNVNEQSMFDIKEKFF